MEPFPFDSDNFNESIIELYKSIFSWLWRKISKPFSKRSKTPDQISSVKKEKAEARESVAMEE